MVQPDQLLRLCKYIPIINTSFLFYRPSLFLTSTSLPSLLLPSFFSLLPTFFHSPLLPPQDYKRMLDLIQANILSTDIAYHLRKMKDMTQMGTGQACSLCMGIVVMATVSWVHFNKRIGFSLFSEELQLIPCPSFILCVSPLQWGLNPQTPPTTTSCALSSWRHVISAPPARTGRAAKQSRWVHGCHTSPRSVFNHLWPFLWYLVQGLETGMFKRQCQYSSLFGKLKADKREVCELQQLSTTPVCLPSRLPDVMQHMTLSPRFSPSVFAYCEKSNCRNYKRVKCWHLLRIKLRAPALSHQCSTIELRQPI